MEEGNAKLRAAGVVTVRSDRLAVVRQRAIDTREHLCNDSDSHLPTSQPSRHFCVSQATGSQPIADLSLIASETCEFDKRTPDGISMFNHTPVATAFALAFAVPFATSAVAQTTAQSAPQAAADNKPAMASATASTNTPTNAPTNAPANAPTNAAASQVAESGTLPTIGV